MGYVPIGLAVLSPRATGASVKALHIGCVAEFLDVIRVASLVATRVNV